MRFATVLSLAAMTGCGRGEDYKAPVAVGLSITTLEETGVRGTVTAFQQGRHSLVFNVTRAPRYGTIALDPATGEFAYVPEVDFFGPDSFGFAANDGRTSSNEGLVSIAVQNVNDAPRFGVVETQTNSAEARDVIVDPGAVDPDGDALSLGVQTGDPEIVGAWADSGTKQLVLRARSIGVTTVTVTASDGQLESSVNFDFHSQEVVKFRDVTIPAPAESAIEVRNDSPMTVDFSLTYSGVPIFESVQDMLTYVRAMPDKFPGEELDRKIWRFVRDFTYHNVPFNAKQWLYSPWVTINSLGWGFCGHVAAAFVEIARAAGYEARIWGLSGHVVAEILVNGDWRMYDADLAVYYKDRNGKVAGVEVLGGSRDLLVAPIEPIFAVSTYGFPYSDLVADIYTSVENNFVGDQLFLATEAAPRSRFELPPGSKLVFPGRWTEPPIGFNGAAVREIIQYGQASLWIPPGWSGALSLPLMLWDAQGAGVIDIDGVEYVVGSEDLRTRIRDSDGPIGSLSIVASNGLSLIFFINAMQFGVASSESVAIKGLDVWALGVSVVQLPKENARGPIRFRKPVPITATF